MRLPITMPYYKSRMFIMSAFIIVVVVGVRWLTPPLTSPGTPGGANIVEDYLGLPLAFEANQGQVAGQAEFLSRGSGYTLFLAPTEAVLALRSPATTAPAGNDNEQAILHMQLIGANPAAAMSGLEELPGRVNYFIGDDPTNWHTDVPTYAGVRYEAVYAGVDLLFHGTQRQLEYDFVIAPETDPDAITLGFQDAHRLETDARGNLILYTDGGEVVQQAPIIYQEINGVRRDIAGSFVLNQDRQVGFEVGAYDTRWPLVIDPIIQLHYSTYLGGNRSDHGEGITVDAEGNVYVTGWTSSSDFPLAPRANPIQRDLRGRWDVFITKLNPTLTEIRYSTFLGGRGESMGKAIAVDADGNAYVTGHTTSEDFPTAPSKTAPPFCLDDCPLQETLGGGFDAFVAKLDPTGSALRYSTFLGGRFYDEGFGIAVDSAGEAYVTGWTDSSDFPLSRFRPPIFEDQPGRDAFVAKLNGLGSELAYSTYLGGEDGDGGMDIAVDPDRNAYVTGWTSSPDFPLANAWLFDQQGSSDAFVTKVNAAGSQLVYSSYLGGNSSETEGTRLDLIGPAIAVDDAGIAYVAGSTTSADFPTLAGGFDRTCGDGFFASAVFVTRLRVDGFPEWSTCLGGSDGSQYGADVAIDQVGNAYVTGLTNATDFPTLNAVQGSLAGDDDAFVTKLSPDLSALAYSTYLGGWSEDFATGIALDSEGNAYVTGWAAPGFPTTFNTYQPNWAAGGGDTFDAFVSRIGEGYVIAPINRFTMVMVVVLTMSLIAYFGLWWWRRRSRGTAAQSTSE